MSAQALGYLAEANAALGRHDLAGRQFTAAVAQLGQRLGEISAIFLQSLEAHAAFAAALVARAEAEPLQARLAAIERRRNRVTAQDLARVAALATAVAR